MHSIYYDPNTPTFSQVSAYVQLYVGPSTEAWAAYQDLSEDSLVLHSAVLKAPPLHMLGKKVLLFLTASSGRVKLLQTWDCVSYDYSFK